eukprot:jgi/Orpsp1_1/1191739/evm.model.d7180000088145.1
MSTINENFLNSYSNYVNTYSSSSQRSVDSFTSNLTSLIESHYDLRKFYDVNGNRIENSMNIEYNENEYKDIDNNGDEIEGEVNDIQNQRSRPYNSRFNRINNSLLNYGRLLRYRQNNYENSGSFNYGTQRNNVNRNAVRHADDVSLMIHDYNNNYNNNEYDNSQSYNNSYNNSNNNNSNNNNNNNNYNNTNNNNTNNNINRNSYENILNRTLTASPTSLLRSDDENLSYNRSTSFSSSHLSPYINNSRLQERYRYNYAESNNSSENSRIMDTRNFNNNLYTRHPIRRNAIRINTQPSSTSITSTISSISSIQNPSITITNENGYSSVLHSDNQSRNSIGIEENNNN